MKRAAYGISLVAVAALLLAAVPTEARADGWRGHPRHGQGWHGQGWHGRGWHGRGWYGHRWHGHGIHGPRIVVGLGPGFWWGPRPGWYAPPPAYVYPPRVIVQEPTVYIQREAAPEPPPSYWYYCESAGAYYPSVPSCPEPWVKVPPRPE